MDTFLRRLGVTMLFWLIIGLFSSLAPLLPSSDQHPMSIELKRELPKRLRVQRDGIGYSVAEVAHRSGLSVEEIERFESGSQLPELHQLIRLAETLGVDPMALLSTRQKALDPARLPARFRTQEGADLLPDDVRLLSVAADVGRIGHYLWKLVEPAPPRIQPGYRAPDGGHPGEEGARLGIDARKRLYPQHDPIPNLKAALETCGVHVAWVRFQDKRIEGATLIERDALPVILLNLNADKVRKLRSARMVLAHELCHVLHDAENEKRRLLRSAVTFAHVEAGQGSREEQRANAFAPAFLAPSSWVLDEVGQDPVEIGRALVERWHFSQDAARWHTRVMLGLSMEDANRLLSSLRSVRAKDRELQESRPPPSPQLTDGLVTRLAEAAHRRALISEGRLHEIRRMR
jgi:Zn-dependent peptidase ImmA (M78 family)/transcriptional regulator with XRE-family HTH domain